MLRRNKPGQIHQADQGARGGNRASAAGRADAAPTGLTRQGEAHRANDGAPAREPFTYVHRGTVVIGEIIATGRVRVHGEVKGNVKVNGVLEVAESGSVEGKTVEAHVVKVLGRVTADVVAGGKVEIWKGGVLTGNVSAPVLDIEEGATFNGFSHMVPEGSGGERLAVEDVTSVEDTVAPEGGKSVATGPRASSVGRASRHGKLDEAGADSLTPAAEEA